MIVLENVGKTFGDKKVLSDVNLKINEGEIYGLVGLSGAGKSTLLRIIGSIEKETKGKVKYPKNAKFGFVFQNFNLVNALNVEQNIALALINDDSSIKQKSKRIDEVLELVGLSDFKNCFPKSLSGGQKQRVGIARALVSNIDILLCDEATSALDPITASEIIDLLNVLNKTLKLTIIFVSHQLEIVKNFCDHIAILDQARVVETGRVIDVFANPKSMITKNLLASLLGTNQFDDKQEIKECTCFTEDDVYELLIKLKQSAKIKLINQHQTKQGLFTKIYYEKKLDGRQYDN